MLISARLTQKAVGQEGHSLEELKAMKDHLDELNRLALRQSRNESGIRPSNRANLLAVQIVETHAGGSKSQSDCVGRAVALFGNNQFSNIFFVVRHVLAFFGRLVNLGPVDERNEIGILFQGA